MPSFIPLAATALLTLVWGYSWILNKIAITALGPFTFSAWRMLIASLCLLLAMALSGRSLKPTRWPEMLRLGLIQTTGFIGLSMWALLEGSVGRTSILVFTMPFWTVALAWPVLGHVPTGAEAMGLFIAVVGLRISVTAGRRAKA